MHAATQMGQRIAAAVDPLLDAELSRRGIPGAAVVVVIGDEIAYQAGRGFADLEAKVPVRVDTTVWPIASITKVFTATAVMQLVDEGKVRLDDDVNKHLRRVRVPATFPEPITVADLLRHSTGLDELRGRRVETASALVPLHEFLAGHLVRFRRPGLPTHYSSYGMALAGALVADVSGQSYAERVKRSILEPLGMTHAWFMDREGADAGLARAYEMANGKAQLVPHEWYHTLPSSSLAASAVDMAQFLRAHLGDGCAGQRCILRGPTARAMRTEQLTLHPRLPGWGLGFQLRRSKGRMLVEHGGNIGGFASMLVMMPDAHLGVFVVHHGEGEDLWRPVIDAVLDTVAPPSPVVRPQPVPRTKAELARYAGRYRANAYCRTCADPGWVQDFEVTVNEDATLGLADRRWVPAGDDYFVRDDGGDAIGFYMRNGRAVAITAGSYRVQERLDPAP